MMVKPKKTTSVTPKTQTSSKKTFAEKVAENRGYKVWKAPIKKA